MEDNIVVREVRKRFSEGVIEQDKYPLQIELPIDNELPVDDELPIDNELPVDDERQCKGGIPARYVVVLLGCFGFFNIYAMRVNLSVAMVAMVNTTTNSVNDSKPIECPALIKENEPDVYSSQKGEKYNWNANTQSLILEAFFYGYVVPQIPAGIVAEKFGAKWLFGIGVGVTALFSLLSPLAADLGIEAFIAARVIEGLGESVTFPAMNALLSRWSPKYERSFLTTVVYTGAQIGNVIAMPISGFLSDSEVFGGWPSVFYFFGTIGVLWFILWTIFIYGSPSNHPRISKEELILILQDKEQDVDVRHPVPWKSIVTSIPVWALTIANFGQLWGFLILLTELPTYLSNMLHFSLKSNGVFSALPYVLQALTAWIVSYAADRIRKSERFKINTIRKTANTIGFFGPAICLLLITIAGCRPMLIICLLCLALAFNGFIYSGYNVTHVDMSPDYAGILMGITNGFGNLSGILGPAVVGYFTTSGHTFRNWNNVFYITAGIYVSTALIYLRFGTAELQPWGIAKSGDVVPETKKENNPVYNEFPPTNR